jgi:uracil-DNA glycosylase
MGAHAAALARFLASPASEGWGRLPFFKGGEAARLAGRLDQRVAEGAPVLPAPEEVFAALALTRPNAIRVVILGQDPYPTPGHAHGLAFSYRGPGPLPASLKRILRELEDDLGVTRATDLTGWARQGVLLLNTALSVEAGRAGAHLSLGWSALADQSLGAVSEASPAVAFLLWGDKARARRGLIHARHLLIESAHPSPLAARGDFLGSRPFSRANAWLVAQGVAPIDWAA